MGTSTDLDTLVGNAFSPTAKTAAIALANKYFATADGDSDGEDLATAMLAHAILLNKRQAERGNVEISITAMNIDELVTPEMERLLNKPVKPTFYEVIRTLPLPNRHWSG